jgi:hypothetical protein
VKLLLCRHLWGVDEPWETFFPTLKPKGYGAVDAALWDEASDSRLEDELQKNGLQFVAMVYSMGESVAEHLRCYEGVYKRALALKPLRIYAHAGKDSFTEAQQNEFFSAALSIDPRVAFETHRGRILYNPWTTARLMEKFPQLRLNSDLSHWACISESLLEGKGEQAILKEAAERTDHLHARVGHEQGPQVSDPRLEMWKAQRDAHEGWWDQIWESQKRRGMEFSTLTPEFGPPPYQPINPISGQVDVNLAEICDWQAQRQKERFQRRGFSS